MKKIKAKTDTQIKIMAEGGKRLGKVKKELKGQIQEGRNAAEIEELADRLFLKLKEKHHLKWYQDIIGQPV
ncbi:hypothetical protein A2Z22_02210 [Candidatus Woesebacteria bacterium RBG_16_34_12]|uniref:Uncharacterized protein n=1 Tax=Candidatus Woesebacteria bacterium RBG_16_34_12 TaxID=1802480 RepID=A0A1F7XB11_9BACT|nr:MAG: hypothetical protein A2Z22_02210 [Candidatus Woesebacteria bacterium RBG_16_34_12]